MSPASPPSTTSTAQEPVPATNHHAVSGRDDDGAVVLSEVCEYVG